MSISNVAKPTTQRSETTYTEESAYEKGQFWQESCFFADQYDSAKDKWKKKCQIES